RPEIGEPWLLAVPLAVWAIWQCLLFYRWGELPLIEGSHVVGSPFSGLLMLLQQAVLTETPMRSRWIAELGVIGVLAVGAVYRLRSSSALPHEKLAWLLYAALAATLSESVWSQDWSFLRALTELSMLGAVILLGARSGVKAPVLGTGFLLWLMVFGGVGSLGG